jgi:hypothetical protein
VSKKSVDKKVVDEPVVNEEVKSPQSANDMPAPKKVSVPAPPQDTDEPMPARHRSPESTFIVSIVLHPLIRT